VNDGRGESDDGDRRDASRTALGAGARPRGRRDGMRRPVSGLAGLDRSPSRRDDSGFVERSAPAHRCGGSRGMARASRGTAFPFHPPRLERAADTCALILPRGNGASPPRAGAPPPARRRASMPLL
jgi:hypothetical protein